MDWWDKLRCRIGWHKFGEPRYVNYYRFFQANPEVAYLPHIVCQTCEDCGTTECNPRLIGTFDGRTHYDSKYAGGVAKRLTKEWHEKH